MTMKIRLVKKLRSLKKASRSCNRRMLCFSLRRRRNNEELEKENEVLEKEVSQND